MCGIFGVINTKERIEKGKVLAARDVMANRGPDDAGLYFSQENDRSLDYARDENIEPPFAALAHRRLSIIDLSPAGHQPMTTQDGRYTIVFNGEIYNYVELSQKSEVRSQKLHSNSDTEIILTLYSLYGRDCLSMLRGMFAFAIWDDKEKKLFAARDRFGIKPFYYYKSESEFVFASEVKAIKHYKNNLTVSVNGLDVFLRTGSVPAPLTIYNEVNALLPGNYLTIKNAQLLINNYWDFNDLISQSFTKSFSRTWEASTTNVADSSLYVNDIDRVINKQYNNEAKQIIKSALLDSVKAHMVSDVEVGAFLSGGIDSTAILSLMRQMGKEKIKTVSIVFPGNKLNESKYSRLAAKTYNTEHIEIPFYEKDLLDDFEIIIESMDQPTIDGINTYFVSKAAKQAGLKVVLSGLGGDELFGGYPSFFSIPKYQRIKNLPFARAFMKTAAPLLKKRLPAKAIEYMKDPDTENAEYKMMRGLFTDNELLKLGWSNHSEPVKGTSHISLNEAWQSPSKHLSLLQYVSMMETTKYMRNQLLRDSDVFSMAHSLELRVPFVDHLLYGTVLPYLENGFDKNFTKKMLVQAVGDLPDEIVHRPKMGFTFPFTDWIMKGQLKDSIIEKIKNLDNALNINYSALSLNKLHWSRLWALHILSRFL